jgi:hypothetical protein
VRIAALYVQRRGVYAGIAGVDCWDTPSEAQLRLAFAERDARAYSGPGPVVAHPPCARWCRLAGLVEKRWGHRRGADGGCFAAALAAVRTFGGVLEHPAHSLAWAAFDLPRPDRAGGWTRGLCGGFSCHVEQGRYGHRAPKATWLYAVGTDLPDLRWGRAIGCTHVVGHMELRGDGTRFKAGDSRSARPRGRRPSFATCCSSSREALQGGLLQLWGA